MIIQDIQNQYEEAYKERWENRNYNEVHLSGTSDEGTKVFVEKDFYYCGWNHLWMMRNTVANRQLNRELKGHTSKHYGGGVYIDIKAIGQQGNGDYEIQHQAYCDTAKWLNLQGYDIQVESRLD